MVNMQITSMITVTYLTEYILKMLSLKFFVAILQKKLKISVLACHSFCITLHFYTTKYSFK